MQLKVEMQEVLLAKEEQEEVLRRRERELTALKGALKEEVSAHDKELDKMKDQYEKELSKLQTSLEEAKQVVSHPFGSLKFLSSTLLYFDSLWSLLICPSHLQHSVLERCGYKHNRACCGSCATCSSVEFGPFF